MSRVLAFSDLRGNAVALKNMLDEAYDAGLDYMLIGGDLTDLEYYFGEGEIVVRRAKRSFRCLKRSL